MLIAIDAVSAKPIACELHNLSLLELKFNAISFVLERMWRSAFSEWNFHPRRRRHRRPANEFLNLFMNHEVAGKKMLFEFNIRKID